MEKVELQNKELQERINYLLSNPNAGGLWEHLDRSESHQDAQFYSDGRGTTAYVHSLGEAKNWKHPRALSANELGKLLTPLDVEIYDEYSELLEGDIIAFFGSNSGIKNYLTHSATYVGKDNIFIQNGERQPFELWNLDRLMNIYGRGDAYITVETRIFR